MHSQCIATDTTLLLLSVAITLSDIYVSDLFIQVDQAWWLTSSCFSQQFLLLLGIGFFGLSPIYPHHPTHLEFFIWNSSYQRLDSFELIPSHPLWCKYIQSSFTPSLVHAHYPDDFPPSPEHINNASQDYLRWLLHHSVRGQMNTHVHSLHGFKLCTRCTAIT